MSMLISSEKSSLAITIITVTSVNHWIYLAITLHMVWPMEQIYFQQNKCTAVSMGHGGFFLLSFDVLYGNLSMHWQIAESHAYLRQVMWALNAHTKVAVRVRAGYFGGEENFAVIRNITEIETILFIKYVSVYFLYFYVFMCPISMTFVLVNFAIRS